MKSLPVYLDYNATTPVHPEVAEAMRPYLSDLFGNPSSTYSYGALARTEVEKARRQVAGLFNCHSHEIIFTSGGSESNNLAIKGVAAAYSHKGNHIITSSIEHPAVAEVCNYLEKQGFRITRLDVDSFGLVNIEELVAAIGPETLLITIMHANNEIGTIQPIKEIAAIARNKGVLFHTDAAQTAGKIQVDDLGADLISLAGHKLYGPKGVGALYVREGVKLEKIIHGADHEQNLRAGTENIMSVAGLGKACELAKRDLERNIEKMKAMRELLHEKLLQKVPDLRLNGHPELRLPNTLNVSFRGVDVGLLLPSIADKVAASAGAACHAAEVTLSPTLEAIKVPPDYAAGTIRFSVGHLTTAEEIEFAADVIGTVVTEITGAVTPKSPERDFSNGTTVSPTSKPETRNPETETRNPKPETRNPKRHPERSEGPNPESEKDLPRLTQHTQGLGCACKLKPQLLQQVMADMPVIKDARILVGTETFDDAAVYQVSEDLAIVQTVDFFTPVVDDPYDFGRIAAANALSDIYAMGATPRFALNIAAFPSTRLSPDVLRQILQGASAIAQEAGIPILGGHTVDDLEPKFGMAVTGQVHPSKIIRNSTARPGDVLVLTKAIGTGILATALKRGLLDEVIIRSLTETMATLNKGAADIMASYPVNACTDVTGFGLLGHLVEMTTGSSVEAEVDAKAVPLLPHVEEFAASGILPGGTQANLQHFSRHIDWADDIPAMRRSILCDAQTSGGLLIALPEKKATKMLTEMRSAGIEAVAIGNIIGPGSGRVRVVSR